MKVQLENIDVHAFFEYKDGQLIWKMLPDYYAEWNVLNRLNSRFFGTRAGRLNKRGYRDIGIWGTYRDWETDRKSTRLNSSHSAKSRMPSSA